MIRDLRLKKQGSARKSSRKFICSRAAKQTRNIFSVPTVINYLQRLLQVRRPEPTMTHNQDINEVALLERLIEELEEQEKQSSVPQPAARVARKEDVVHSSAQEFSEITTGSNNDLNNVLHLHDSDAEMS